MIYIHIDHIDDNPFQTRREYGDVEALAMDIQALAGQHPDTYGLLQVPMARIVSTDDGELVPHQPYLEDLGLYDAPYPMITAVDRFGTYARVQLLYGHRRLRAFRWLAEHGHGNGLMPLILCDAGDDQMLDAVWTENQARADLADVEQAELMHHALKLNAFSQKELAEHWRLGRSTVANKLSLLSLPEPVREANRRGELSERQALSLKPILQLQERLDGRDVQWGRTDQHWGPPVSPDAYLAHVVEHPDKASSDDIRDYGQRMLRHAGEKLPESFNAVELAGAGVIQAACKGCPKRLQDQCLQPECLALKKKAYGLLVTNQVAEELGLPVSQDKKHFAQYDAHMKMAQLERAWKAGTCPHLVVGWVFGYAARPFSDFRHVSEYETYEDRRGVALGCTHYPLGDCAPPAEAVADDDDFDPLAEKAERYKEVAAAQRKAMEKRLRALLAEELRKNIGYLTPFAALASLAGNQVRPDDDWEKIPRDLVDFCWQKGRFFNYDHDSAYRFHARAVELLDLFAMGHGALFEPGIDEGTWFTNRVERLLGWWAGSRHYHYISEERAAEFVPEADRLLDECKSIDLDPKVALDLIDDLTAFQEEAQGVLDRAAAEKEEEQIDD